ncbi:DUF6503 family protein [Algoriphagus hitonicola]|uniref:Deoxyribose-phosphate aldolase n=1 Tax=Algoriphagus hitonicola TaxID=435880 RepID=A0A1I2TRL4_9BACT|nr:DUF6503 family protein [Algoriphagus hitonicola]SFG65086.1 hypothetical protein SAMN04487988_10670 [Algoriphagus hitonicola]
MKKNLFLIILGLVVLIQACDQRSEAQKIVDLSIEAHGGKAFEESEIEFDFRDIHYQIFKTSDSFEYSREFQDSTGQIKDVLNNSGFVRTLNGAKVDTLTEERIGAFSRSVNSVAYFAFLPYGLNDAATIKNYLGETTLNGESYHLIEVTFEQEGGGEDFDDIFLYWIGVEDYFVDFMAYSYHTDGGGVRMREVSDVQEAGGIRFQNYLNYKPEDKDTPVDQMQSLYEAGDLELLSEINLENIEVRPLNR